jgi:cytochrome P450
MAYMQLQLGLALLVLTFDLELQDPEKQRTPHPVQNTATLPMRSGLPVRLKLRSTP